MRMVALFLSHQHCRVFPDYAPTAFHQRCTQKMVLTACYTFDYFGIAGIGHQTRITTQVIEVFKSVNIL